jgi:hypothetical protein
LPMGGFEDGPVTSPDKRDLSDRGPSGARFVYLEDINLEPKEDEAARLTRVPGPGEAGFVCAEQKNLFLQVRVKSDRDDGRSSQPKTKAIKR